MGSIIGLIKGDARSLDHSSYGKQWGFLAIVAQFP